jgi:hypothetical protein
LRASSTIFSPPKSSCIFISGSPTLSAGKLLQGLANHIGSLSSADWGMWWPSVGPQSGPQGPWQFPCTSLL